MKSAIAINVYMIFMITTSYFGNHFGIFLKTEFLFDFSLNLVSPVVLLDAVFAQGIFLSTSLYCQVSHISELNLVT